MVTDLASGRTPAELAAALVGTGVTVSNVSYTGNDVSAGSFTGGGDIGFSSGIVLSSGRVRSTGTGCADGVAGVEGPNECGSATTDAGTAGDAALDALTTDATEDAAILEFDFVPSFATVSFDYVFGSDEYNEFANSSFNDVFGFFVNGTNCATVDTPGGPVPVTINTINGGNPFGTNPQNPSLYRNNSVTDPGPATINTELDGLTVVLHCNAAVNQGTTNHLKLAIADVNDDQYDSAVLLGAATLVSGVQITDNLTSGALSGQDLTVPAGSSVVDTATLQGATASTATGTVTYTVYSDAACTTVFANPGTKTVGANGVVPAADPVTLTANGSYYWKSSYSGDVSHNPATSACTAKATVTDGTTTTTATTTSTTSTTVSSTTSTTVTSTTSTTVTSSTSSTSSTTSTTRASTTSTSSGGASSSSTSTTAPRATSSSTAGGVLANAGGTTNGGGKLVNTGGGVGPHFYLGLFLVGIGLVMVGEGMAERDGLVQSALRRVRTRLDQR